MYGLMHQLDMCLSLHATHQSGKSGGRTPKMWSCFSLWARIMFLFIRYVEVLKMVTMLVLLNGKFDIIELWLHGFLYVHI